MYDRFPNGERVIEINSHLKNERGKWEKVKAEYTWYEGNWCLTAFVYDD